MAFYISGLIIAGAIYFGLLTTYKLHQIPERPDFDLNKWWGPGKPEKEDVSIRPFTIDFSENVIQDLKQRITNRRNSTKTLEGIQSQYGMNTDYLENILDYWINKYDFKQRAELLNKFPHYKTKVQGLDIHFIRVKPKVKKGVHILPILILHGWPSSSKEYINVIPILTTPRDGFKFVFEVVAADLPGFGFSEGTRKPNLNPVQIAIIMRNLMLRLGHEKFYIQAGDWGSQVATHLATLFPSNVLGFHTNMPLSSRTISLVKMVIGSFFPKLIDDQTPERLYPLIKYLKVVIIREGGYYHLQATKPDTVGVALSDSPSGLAAYLIEKLAVGSNRDQLNTPHGGIENLDLDEVLDTVTIMWVNNCIVTSMRLYYEAYSLPEVQTVKEIPTEVPTAAIKFLYEIVYQPDWILRDKFPNLVRSTIKNFGGHFAGLQTPKELAEDVFESVKAFIKFHKNKKVK